MNRFTIRQLEFFVGAGQFGNLTEAGKRLNVSQPAITSAVSHLEQLLGHKLFQRIPGAGVSPTAIGRLALADARKILVSLNNFQEKYTTSTGAPRGHVTMACFEPLACLQLPGLLGKVAHELPEVTVDFSLASQAGIRSGLLNGEFELGLSYDSGFWEDITKETLYYVTPRALLPANHRLAKFASFPMAELANEPFVLVDLPESREYQLSLMGRCGLEPRVKYYCGNIEVIRGIVANGLAVSISVTNPTINQSYEGLGLVTVPFSDAIAKQAVVVAYSDKEHLTPTARATIDVMKNHFDSLELDHRAM